MKDDKLNYFIITEGVSKDTDHKKVSLFNVYNSIRTATLPLTSLKLVVAFAFFPSDQNIKKGEMDILITVDDPSGERRAEITGKSTRKKETESSEVREMISSVDIGSEELITEYGVYVFKLYVNNKLLGENRLEVRPPVSSKHKGGKK